MSEMQPQSLHVLFRWEERSFQSQFAVSQPPSLFFDQQNDPSMLCDRFMGAFRTHSSTHFVTDELPKWRMMPVTYLSVIIGTFRSEYEYDYEFEFSVLSTRIRFRGRHFSKCACSERKTRTRSRTRTPI